MVPAVADSDSSDPADEPPIVTGDGITKRYIRAGRSGGLLGGSDRSGTTVTALADVDLRVSPGEIVGLSGPSGSGKSTLLHLLAGLDVPSAGSVTLAGEDPASMSERGRARLRLEAVGMIFQRFHLLPSLSALENVTLPMIERGVPAATRRDRGRTLLEDVGLSDRADHVPGDLSGGEQQRVAIARALALDPPLIVADEPTGELDTATGEQILERLADVASEGRAVVLASHDDAALAITDRVVELRDGRIIDG